MAEETWDTRELQILEAVYRARDEGAADLNAAGRAAVPDLDDRRYVQAIADLQRAGFVTGGLLMNGEGLDGAYVIDITPEGLRKVGAWPSDSLADAFIKVLGDRVASEEDPECRKLLAKLLEHSIDVGKGVLTSVLAQAAMRGL